MKTTIPASLMAALLVVAGCSGRGAPVATRPGAAAPAIVGQSCAQCHGATGMSTSADIPNLAGQHPEYLVRQLRAFREHSRNDALAVQNMWKASHGLDDRAIDEVAAYYATQTPVRQPVLGTPEQIAA